MADYENSARQLLEFSHACTPISQRLRLLPMRHFPYSIIYQATAEAITIRAVVHQRRLPGYWGGRR